ncbi:MAG: hypothetical protein KKC80_02060 [Candidatus Margulisbacteria bacterium]|nr:hypothetical protein [Candidatus Margulisiibacteriota bacterium]MBU1616272.1 hypothetical protein [Candidatus Margulisiibacteriota bacterium]MBU1867039.1 hypothetical protein [Candidatus Margulisiibacteriota bacterium]
MLRMIGYGLILWVIPYVTAIPLMGLMTSDPTFFKTIMIVEASLIGAILTVVYFAKVEKDYLKEGLILGIVWLAVNWLMDFIALLPLSKMPFNRYFIEIGLRYFIALAMTVPVGYLLDKKVK